MKQKLISLILLILLSIFSCNAYAKTEATVFILDSKVDYDFVKQGSIPLQGEITHGSIVGRIIYQEAETVDLKAYNVEQDGKLKQELYFQALNNILDYTTKHPNELVIVNISLSFSKKDKQHQELLKKLKRHGVVIVAAAGNDNSKEVIYPAGFEETTAVANATKKNKAPSSNYGGFVDLCAPGSVKYIARLYLPQGITTKSLRAVGTSFSAPRVTGLLAKILSLDSTLSTQQGLELILGNTEPVDDIKYKEGLLGKGVINPTQTLAQVDHYYYLRHDGTQIVLAVLLGFLFLYWIKKYRVVGFFLAVLLLLVLLPLSLLLQEVFVANLKFINLNLQQLKSIDYFYFIGAPLFLLVITSWEKKFIGLSYLGCSIGLIFLVSIIKELTIGLDLYLEVGITMWLLILIVWEQWQLYQVQQQNDLYSLVRLLASKSQKVSNLASKKLKNKKIELARLLSRMEQLSIPFAVIKEVVLGDNNNIAAGLMEVLGTKQRQGVLELVIKLLKELDQTTVLESLKKELLVADNLQQINFLKAVEKLETSQAELLEIIRKLSSSEEELLRLEAQVLLSKLED
ncbi:MAG: S8 family serine peptidase [Bacillota bacterium]